MYSVTISSQEESEDEVYGFHRIERDTRQLHFGTYNLKLKILLK